VTTPVPILEARHLTKHFGTLRTPRNPRARRLGPRPAGTVVHAVEDVSLALAPARVTAVVGESGSGKSTLARMLARLISPTAGDLLLDGQAASGARRPYTRQVQMVLQDPFASLNPVHDVRYHLARPLLAHGLARRAELDEVITGLLERVALTPGSQYLHKYPHELSGGQRQRVAIARALVNKPAIILADEPTGNLDSQTGNEIMALFDRLHAEGNTIVLVTHEHDIAEYAHRIVYIKDGVVAKDEVKS
jgi:peptide/nickel transport system ATP-binding protein